MGALRKEGYIYALKNKGIEAHEDLIYRLDDSQDLYDQIEKVINVPNPPDAILAVNEIYAANALIIAKKRGLKVPEDIAIIGFTSGLISDFTSPPLTCIAQHGVLMGRQAAELLIDRIENTGPKEFQIEVISPDLKIRESTLLEG